MKTRAIFAQQRLPVFQNKVYASREAARNCMVGDILLVEDQHTGIICNAAFDASLVTYDADYQNEQALSPAFRSHLSDVADIVLSHLGNEGLVEVGCGKATFLEILQSRGASIIGYDPAYEGCNPAVVKSFFDASCTSGKAVVLRHVLEHVDKPLAFLQQLREFMGGTGRVYIEVPCFEWICDKQAWFDIFYEHVNYFRISDFGRLFSRLLDSGHFFGGQYLYVVARLEDLVDQIRYSAQAEPPSISPPFSEPNRKWKLDNGPTVVWGGSSKGVIFSLLYARSGGRIDYVVDINPAKQGKFLPCTGLPVYAPEALLPKLPDRTTIIVMNPNYSAEIRSSAGTRFNFIEATV